MGMRRSEIEALTKRRRVVAAIDILFLVLLLAMFLIGLWLLLRTKPIVWVDLLYDDAYYYLGVVRGIVENGQSSFMPPFDTNGYQPLWLIFLVISGFVFGTSVTSLAIQAYVMCFLFVLIFLYLSYRHYGFVFPAIICAFALPYIMLFGMETAMLPAFFILFVTSSGWTKRGISGSLLFLTRLDGIAVVLARDVYFYVRQRECDFRHYRIIVPVILAYAAINYSKFGIFLPVSGLVKAMGNIPGENFSVGFGYFRALGYANMLFAIALLVLRARGKKLTELRFFDELMILLIACAMCIGYYSLNSGWPVWDWYYWAPFLLTYYALMEVVFAMDKLQISARPYSSIGLFLLVLFGVSQMLLPAIIAAGQRVVLLYHSSNINSLAMTFGRKNVELADWIRRKSIPSHSFFAMGDRAGSFGYFLGRDFRFMHAEGLVGPVGYYQAMRNNVAPDFINALDINYWIADRERFLETRDIIGVIEPVQALSAHVGPYVICFFKSGIIYDQSYTPPQYGPKHQHEIRYVFDMNKKTDCPAALVSRFAALKNRYGGIRKYSLPFEYEDRSWFARMVNLPW